MLQGSCLIFFGPYSLDPSFHGIYFQYLVHWVIHFCLKLKYEMNKNVLN